jgi:ubiquinone/menaquinone biosynthesis C-methylase UbiE
MAARYESWYDTPRGRRFDAAQKDAVSRLLPVPEPGQTLLEAGCGTGHWARFFAQCGYEVTGLDLSPEMIAVRHCRACGVRGAGRDVARRDPEPACRREP